MNRKSLLLRSLLLGVSAGLLLGLGEYLKTRFIPDSPAGSQSGKDGGADSAAGGDDQ